MHTLFSLIATYGTSEIPVAKLAKDLYDIERDEANRRAARQEYLFPVYRMPGFNGKISQKSPWLASAAEVAKAIDQAKTKARTDWKIRHVI